MGPKIRIDFIITNYQHIRQQILIKTPPIINKKSPDFASGDAANRAFSANRQ